MEKNYFIANFKANITPDEGSTWLDQFTLASSEEQVVIACAPFVTIPAMAAKQHAVVRIGSQDVSKFDEGAFTGEVTLNMLAGLVEYVLIGHSERKKYFHETLEDVAAKLVKVNASSLHPILCLNGSTELFALKEQVDFGSLDLTKTIMVYEPASAISGGGALKPDSKENIAEEVAKIKSELDIPVLYGGSVSAENIGAIIPSNVQGVLVGQKSLSPSTFLPLISNFPSF